jgi:adenosyl cobinamide kinase/adenosyl cobinamide phosphate guanylyltransferase
MSNAIDYAKFRSRSHDAVIRIYDEVGNVIATHEHAGKFRDKVVDCRRKQAAKAYSIALFVRYLRRQ